MTLFGLFKKKETTPDVGRELLRMAEEQPEAFVQFIEPRTRNERLMILIGQSIAKMTIRNIAEAYKNEIDFQEFVKAAQETYLRQRETNEIASRRAWWCLVGGCVFRFGEIQDPLRIELGGRLWVALLDSLSTSGDALKHNVIWSDLEKSLFQIDDAEMAMSIIGRSEMPARFRDSQAVRSFEELHDLRISKRF